MPVVLESRDMVAAAAAFATAVTVWVSGRPAAIVLLTAVLATAVASVWRCWRARIGRERRWGDFELGFWAYVRERGELDRRRP
jgi:hypothetical protein